MGPSSVASFRGSSRARVRSQNIGLSSSMRSRGQSGTRR
jgi:hypothetical protein